MQASEIASRLTNQVESVAKYLLPNGKRSGGYWEVGSVEGEVGKSLKVNLTGSKAGKFCDFAAGQSGDLLNLWSLTKNISLGDAIVEAKAYLGIVDAKPEHSPSEVFNKPKKPVKTFSVNYELRGAGYTYLTQERKLTDETLTAFRVATDDKKMTFPFYQGKDVVNVKYLGVVRRDNKKLIRSEKDAEPCLFGWQAMQDDCSEIVVCEGEIDAMTLHQYGYAALSVPYGAKNQQWIEFDFDRLAKFDKIYLCFDQDKAGQESLPEIANRLGKHRCYIATLPYKDANECLQAGVAKGEIDLCFAQSKTFDPPALRNAGSYRNELIESFYPADGKEKGINSPWKKTRGKVLFRPAELSVWTGINGHGKSQFLGQLMLESIRQGEKVCIASMELKPTMLLKRLVIQAASSSDLSPEYINHISYWLNDKLWLFDVVGTAKGHDMLDVFSYAAERYGIKTFVIDSLMKCGIADDDYKGQKEFVDAICDFKNKYDCHVHLVVHPRKGFDESRIPGKLDVKGTGTVTDLADNCFTVWRNKAKERAVAKQMAGETDYKQEDLAKHDCLWVCDKQRNGDGSNLYFGLWFDKASCQYLEYQNQKPYRYVEYSKLTTAEARG